MNDSSFLRSGRSRLGEVALWTIAGVLTISVHAGGAYYLMQQPEAEADSGPPAAIMIELAALPEAVETQETVEANDVEDMQEVESVAPEKVEEAVPAETPQPPPEPVAEETPPEPVPEPQQEVAEPLPEEVPEPVEEVDPIQQQQMAALENVEVPLPAFRPPPPPAEMKVEKKDTPEKKKVERKPAASPPPSAAKEVAKAEVAPSNRTAAPRNSSGLFSSAITPAKWEKKVRSRINSKRPRDLPATGVNVTVNFRVSATGELNSIRILRSTGDASLDQKVISWIQQASPVAEPPTDARRDITLPISIR